MLVRAIPELTNAESSGPVKIHLPLLDTFSTLSRPEIMLPLFSAIFLGFNK